MKTIVFILAFFSAIVTTSLQPAFAEYSSALEEASEQMESEASQPGGEYVVHNKLKTLYNVSDEQIKALRNQNLGYGEIGAALSLAEQLDGGLSSENIQTVLNMRRQDNTVKGWGQIANELNIKPGKVLQPIKSPAKQDISRHPASSKPEHADKIMKKDIKVQNKAAKPDKPNNKK